MLYSFSLVECPVWLLVSISTYASRNCKPEEEGLHVVSPKHVITQSLAAKCNSELEPMNGQSTEPVNEIKRGNLNCKQTLTGVGHTKFLQRPPRPNAALVCTLDVPSTPCAPGPPESHQLKLLRPQASQAAATCDDEGSATCLVLCTYRYSTQYIQSIGNRHSNFQFGRKPLFRLPSAMTLLPPMVGEKYSCTSSLDEGVGEEEHQGNHQTLGAPG